MKKILLLTLITLLAFLGAFAQRACPTITTLPYINTFDVADPCWIIDQNNATETWYHDGIGKYACEYDDNLLDQNEWLISPKFDLSGYSSSNLSVMFNWKAHYEYAVSPYDNYDMFLKVTTDNGATWTTIWDETYEGVFESIVDILTTVDVSAYAGQSSVQFAFNYVGNDGSSWYISDFAIETSGCFAISTLPYINTFDVADPCWTIDQNNTTETWKYDASGAYLCQYDSNYLDQDEWLLSPEFDLSSYSSNNLSVMFNWKASYEWAVDPDDNYDIFLKVTTDNGATWTTIWDETVEGVFETWVIILSTVDVSDYAGQSSVYFAFNYVGNNGAGWSVSDFTLEVASSPCPTISTLPYINTFDVADPCWTINQTNATETWHYDASGAYYCPYDANLLDQDEWFISPEFDLSAYSSSNLNLKFNWQADYEWSVSPHDNYDMFLKVTTDGGTTWTSIWDETVAGVFVTGDNILTTVDVSAYAGQSSVKFAFNYVGNDGSGCAVDDFTLEVASSPCPTISTLPYINKFDVADPCWTINQTNATETWQYNGDGEYACTYDDNLLAQDEWLISPEFDLSSYSSNSLSVMFNWRANYGWSVDPNDNYDMFLKVTTNGGTTWTTIWDETVVGVFEAALNQLSTVDVSAYAGQSSVQFAFNYVGTDGAYWVVSDFTLQVPTPCNVITTLPYINTFDVADPCWTINQTNATETWQYDALYEEYYCAYDANLLDQDEWLISPEFDLSAYSSSNLNLKFNWVATYEYAVDPDDNYDMFLKVTTDNGATWTTIWDETVEGVFETYVIILSTVDVSAYAGQSSVQFAFNYVGNDGSIWSVSDFTLDAETPPCPTISTLPYINTFDVADYCWTIIENNVNANWNYDSSYTAYHCTNDIYYLDQDEWLLSPEFDLSAYSTNNLNVIFNWMADYEWSVSPNNNYDMFLKVTTDGGTTWTSIWDETEAGNFGAFNPRFSTIDVSAYAGQSSVQFAFNYVGNDGSGWYVDDFTLQVASAVAIENSNVVSVYPNPSNGLVNIAVTENSVVSVVDIAGRIISTYNVNANQEVNFTQSAGMYVIRVESNGKVSTHKLIIE